ncbi:serine/threonine protein phosphatase 1 [Rhizobium sp. BK512]|jgi:serine/threonine protein phosphatase 1|uniref:metallophosphoesterase family protein n=1 Tax=Rhizobium sp. BK512 TaxID=2587010 RepID=UPI000DDA2274|nr:metallophosphoesterase family protein [Rhizobium sp. BK512]MBB3565348.1 serine/threonine protein phosphatase 1 [Rhizobium sp. BK512]
MIHIRDAIRNLFVQPEAGSTSKKRHFRSKLSFNPGDFSVVYAIGDVHGCYTELLRAKDIIYGDAENYSGSALLVLLGDYIDRGTQSKEVIEHITKPANGKITQVALCGNHEDEFLRLIDDPDYFFSWRQFAGMKTLNSYGIDPAYLLRHGGTLALARAINEAIPTHHKNLLVNMPSMVTVGNLVFVHAGIRPGVPLSEQQDQDLLWIREPFLTQGPELPVVVVHGHTPVGRPFFGNGRIAIDTGAFATGRLTILRIADGRATILS